MRFGLSSVCPRSFGSPFIGPHRRFFLLFFHVFLSSCLLILILSFSCAYYRPDLSLHTYTHAYSTYIEVQVAQVRYNEVWFIGCPSSLGSSSTATTHTHTHLCLSRPFHFHLSLLRAHVPCLVSGQDGGHTCPASGRRVCVTLRITFRFGTGGVTVDFLVTPMKLWKSIGWKFGRKLPYLFRYLGKQEEMVLDTLVCRCLSFCFPLGYSTGLQVGLSTL